MTEKRKIRQVIASGLIAYSKTARKKFVDSGIGPLFCSTNVNGKSLYEDLPRGTLVEIVALVDEPAPESAACEDCGRPYGDKHGFPDLVLPDDVFAKISDTSDENGLFCPSCLVKRCETAGINCTANWKSGPFASHEPEPERKLVRGPCYWRRSPMSRNEHYYLIEERRKDAGDNGVITSIAEDQKHQWCWKTDLCSGTAETLEAAQQAAEEALADAGLYGFGWEVDAKYGYYIVVPGLGVPHTYVYPDRHTTSRDAMTHYRTEKQSATLWGVAEDGQLHKLDRCEAEAK